MIKDELQKTLTELDARLAIDTQAVSDALYMALAMIAYARTRGIEFTGVYASGEESILDAVRGLVPCP